LKNYKLLQAILSIYSIVGLQPNNAAPN